MGANALTVRRISSALLLAALVCGALVSADADAHGRRGRVGVYFGFSAPLFYPPPVYYYPYAYPRYYYPPTVAVPSPSAPEYIEQNPPAASSPPAASAPSAPSAPSSPSQSSSYHWYYCPDSQTYYPYVQTCPSQWQPVVPHSSPPS
ncbi:MAG: hypothetical protein ACXWVP_06280 [Burkholderiales bacterium]